MTLLLVVAGALVTSNDAGGSIPDWPLAWGKLVPPLEGGIYYAYGHRVLAATVAALTLILALRSRSRLAWLAFGLVVAQALLGGLAVLLVLPKATVIAHACLAQLCFGVLVWQAVSVPSRPAGAIPTPQTIAIAALFAHTILRAAVRHKVVGAIPHMVGAAVAILIVLWAALPVMMQHMREAGALLALTALEIFL